MKIRGKNRKWILHYSRLGFGHENFGCNPMNGEWPISGDGKSSVQCFAEKESNGVQIETKNPNSMSRLLAGKRINGITVQMWAEDRANGLLSKAELMEYCNDVPGLFEEVERLKFKNGV